MKIWRAAGLAASMLAAFTGAAGAQTVGAEDAARKAREVARQVEQVKTFIDASALKELADVKVLTTIDMPELLANVERVRANVTRLSATMPDITSIDADFAGAFGGAAQTDRDQARAARAYDRGRRLLDERQWERAIEAFTETVTLKGTRADGALYWTAWAHNRQGNRPEALATLEKLRQAYPRSGWIDDAKVLEAEVRQRAGQAVSPEAQADEDLKLMAINAVMNIEPDRAVPMLEKLLQGTESLKLKERALFVLAQSNSAEARKVIGDVARGSRNPDLQERAVRYLGVQGGAQSRQMLQDIYKSSPNPDVKRRILNAFMVAGDRERLIAVAREETTPELRREAIRQLGTMNAQEELWQLYQNEGDVENRKAIIRAMFVGGGAERLIQIAQQERDAQLRRTAIQNLGVMPTRRTGEALVALYGNEKDPEVKKVVINGLFTQNNAKALVDIARKETDPEMKKAIVGKLSVMKTSKEAMDYLLEILSKG